jgi:TonB family protein
LEGAAGSLDGTLVLTWFSPNEWREEITLPGFSQVRIASKGRLWTARNVPFESLRAYQLEKLIDLRSAWTVRSDESVEGVKGRKANGVAASCVEVKGKLDHGRRTLCADAQSLLPLTTGALSQDLRPNEYGEYTPWESKQFPRLMRSYERKALAIELRVEELGPSSESAASLLSPPSEATVWDWCDNAQPPREISWVGPQYPDQAQQRGEIGTVSVYAFIAKDGIPSNLAVVRSAGRDLDAATLAVLPRWGFQPAMCAANPIPTETVIEVNYLLAH